MKKFWKLFHLNNKNFNVSYETPTEEEYKVLHEVIKKIKEDIQTISLNTSISAFMIAVNKLTQLRCNKQKILLPLTVVISPFAPHIAEELWHLLGNKESICTTHYPNYDEKYLQESSYEYPITINGKVRKKIIFSLDEDQSIIEKEVLNDGVVKNWLKDKKPKKIIIVKNKIINIVTN